MQRENNALIVVDVQNDFCTGSLAVPDGEMVVPVINHLTSRFRTVIATQDWHPEDHVSFASRHPGKQPYLDSVLVRGVEQQLWPDHCVQDTRGAELHASLRHSPIEVIIRKGTDLDIDSYSAFRDNDQSCKTGLAGLLRDRGIEWVYIAGLALDYCVMFTALDARQEGFNTTVIFDACRAVDAPKGHAANAIRAMRQAGIHLTESSLL